jgi:hypothetical protein
VAEETRELWRSKILPFWRGKTMRDRLFQEMSRQWLQCYQVGLFTEFMEQRAPGHTVLDDKICRCGFEDFKNH